MTIPVSQRTSTEVWQNFLYDGRSVATSVQSVRDAMFDGTNRTMLRALDATLAVSRVLVGAYHTKGNSKLAVIAKEQLDDDTFDLATEAQALEDTCADVLDWFEANFPIASTGELKMQVWNRGGDQGVPRSMSVSAVSLSEAQADAVVTQLDRVLAHFN